MITLSISLVTYKPNLQVLADVLKALASSLAANTNLFASKLYLIDNSHDKKWNIKVKECLEINFELNQNLESEFIISSGNIGYGNGNNLAIKQIQSKYHLVINPDVFVTPQVFSHAIAYMEKNLDVGLLTPAVYGENGAQHFLCKKHPTLFDMYLRGFAPSFIRKVFSQRIVEYEMRNSDYSKIIENVNFPTGCFMFFRSDKLTALKGFDPGFFMYYEDADIGRRMAELAKVVYVPDVKIIHKWARGTHVNLKLKWITVKSGWTYWRKWGGIF